jgi:hypothetical protein
MKNMSLLAGGTLLGGPALSNTINADEIKKLNPEQQEFMERYGKWMDDFIEVIRLEKQDPTNIEYKDRIQELTKRGGEFKPELDKHLADKTFFIIYLESIKRVKNEI